MAKILKPYTIIPANLYISRDADRQVENIIEDMGRPGYVLVSRQMGKTNLLLNAKRKLESVNDIYIYIDLSNPFDTAKACFENIIDSAIETNLEKFQIVNSDILSRRKELSETPPHKQHVNELRLLLKQISGKLVIILDEIDALTKTHYSDQVFAQIRSIYFSRVNYPELDRLTYILSGVVEPTEIIKDPKISPFNIGQKIFLNDFSKTEFIKLIEVSELNLSNEVQERIYYWTQGNPRITWDVCSEVEDAFTCGNEINVQYIDKIIHNFYLTSFDKPPIDNIRELVKKDREIRNAIVEIIYNNGSKVSDKMKNKLYLSGITNYNSESVEIKNKIIKCSVSLEWIKSLEEEEKGLIFLAVECYAAKEYQTALNYFERYLSNNELEENVDKAHYIYMIGFSSYKLSEFAKAIKYLKTTGFDVNDEPKSFYGTNYLIGLCYTYLNDFNEALNYYKIIINSGRKDEIYLKSLLNYGSVSLKSKSETLQNEAFEIFESVINDVSLNGLKVNEKQVLEVKSIAYYNIGLIFLEKSQSENAKRYFYDALNLASFSTKPLITLSLIDAIEDPQEERNLISNLVEQVITEKIVPKDFDPEFPLNFSFDELNSLTFECFINFKDSLFVELKPKLIFYLKKELSEIIYNIGLELINKRDWESTGKLFTYLSTEFENPEYCFNQELKNQTIKLACYFNDAKNYLYEYRLYVKTFIENTNSQIDFIDIENFANLILQLTELKNFDEALNYIKIIDSLKDKIPTPLLVNFLVIYHLELNIYKVSSEINKAIEKANQVIKLANDPQINTQKSNLLGETGIDLIKKNAENFLHNINVRKPVIKTTPRIGRNEVVKVKYNDGSIFETKYKKISEDLIKGECVLIS